MHVYFLALALLAPLLGTCYFLLNYAHPVYLFFQPSMDLWLAIFFWIMRSPPFSVFMRSALNVCTLAIFFWIMHVQLGFCHAYMQPFVAHLLFSFELCIPGIGYDTLVVVLPDLLFSFELCYRREGLEAGAEACPACYFLLNYAIEENIMDIGYVRKCVLLFSFELCDKQGRGVCGGRPLCALAIFFWIMHSTINSIANSVYVISRLAIFFWIMPAAQIIIHTYSDEDILAIFFWIMLDRG